MKKILSKISVLSLMYFLLIGMIANVYAYTYYTDLNESGFGKFNLYATTYSSMADANTIAASIDTDIYMDGQLYDNPKRFDQKYGISITVEIFESYSGITGGHFIEAFTEHVCYANSQEYYRTYTDDSLSVIW